MLLLRSLEIIYNVYAATHNTSWMSWLLNALYERDSSSLISELGELYDETLDMRCWSWVTDLNPESISSTPLSLAPKELELFK